jgi:hypothetical protein
VAEVRLLLSCAPYAVPAPGAVARALHDALGLAAEDIGPLEVVAEGVLVTIEDGGRPLHGPLRLRVGATPVSARRLDEPPWPAGAVRAVWLTATGEASPPRPADVARALGLSPDDLLRIDAAPWGITVEVPAARARDLPTDVQVEGRRWLVSTEAARPERPLDPLLDRFLREHGPDGERALREALAHALAGELDEDALFGAIKKKTPVTSAG